MMRMVDVIGKKRDGQALSAAEIEWFIKEYTAGTIPDYQAAALLMAIYFQGMTREETVTLTLAMAHSGHLMDLSAITDYAVDKHSSGGVGDKTSLVVLPLVAACGVPVAKMSGRGLGFSGGTLDKLEALRGFRVNLSEAEFRTQARQHGIVLCGQTGELAPADGKLYALRDVTGTVPSTPLIASSIMSKKLASGAGGIVLDVKCGVGAFMPTPEAARELAQVMVDIGKDAGRDMIALISDMNQPLGTAVGNALEVVEALTTLRGGGAADFREHCLEVAAYMLKLAGRGKQWREIDENRALLTHRLESGAGFDKFRLLVEIQGGDVAQVDQPTLLPQATLIEPFTAAESGYVAQVLADQVAWASLALGAGREKKGDPIDPAVGVEIFAKVGDAVQAGQRLAVIHANDAAKAAEARRYLSAAFAYSATPTAALPLFYGVLE
jgi:pyrimidine-nucleoside phosphorylase